MSLSGTRARIVALLAVVDGVQAYSSPPAAPTIGDAFPFWAGAEAPDDGAYATTFEHTWQLHVVVPADPVAADQWVEAHLSDVADAVAQALAIDSIRPGRVPAGRSSSSEYNALIITGRTE